MRTKGLWIGLLAWGGVAFGAFGGEEGLPPVIRIAIVRGAATFDEALRAVCAHEYHGTVRVMSQGERAWAAVNVLDVEDYLLGVIGREMDPTGPLEALKAQAVAARTHALFQTIASRDRPYDLVADLSQAYRGKTALHKNVVLALEATRGEVLQYGGLLFPAFFHSDCGGRTESAAAIWPIANPFDRGGVLKMPGGVLCPWCEKSAAVRWSCEMSASALRKAFRDAGAPIEGPMSLRVAERSSSGRVLKVVVGTGKEEKTFSGERLRAILGWSVLKSARFTFERPRLSDGSAGEHVIFRGSGYGHGVGLCQRGTRGMALQGSKYREILAYYFPKAKIGAAGVRVARAR
ncbi:MAG: SpoIID/LytB domain-containing protein [Verrucomicrobiae bacterium]|nr:SpoIID/LytB domain-containing protein [Verrucomicrobiae bacterium]